MVRVRSKPNGVSKKPARRSRRKTPLTTTQRLNRPLQARRPADKPQEKVPEDERNAMFDSLRYFTKENPDMDKYDEFLLLFQTRQPGLYRKHMNGEEYGPKDLNDDVVRGINAIIYQRDTAKHIDIHVPQQEVTGQMKEFNDKYIARLPPMRWNELQDILLTVAPRLRLLDKETAQNVSPSSLPDNVNFMINKYLRKHLSDDVKEEIRREEEGDRDGEEGGLDSVEGGDDAGDEMDVDG